MKQKFFHGYNYVLSLLLCALGYGMTGCSHTKRMVKGDGDDEMERIKQEIEMQKRKGDVKALYAAPSVEYRGTTVDAEGTQIELKQ